MPRPPMFSSLKDGSSSKGNASSAQYLLMIGWTLVSMYVRTCFTTARSSAGKVSTSRKKSLSGGGSGLGCLMFAAVISLFLCVQFCVSDTGEISLDEEQYLRLRTVDVGAVDGAPEIGDEHPAACMIQGEADSFHQVGEVDFGRFALARWRIERRALHRIVSRGVSQIRSVQRASSQLHPKCTGFRQVVVPQLD